MSRYTLLAQLAVNESRVCLVQPLKQLGIAALVRMQHRRLLSVPMRARACGMRMRACVHSARARARVCIRTLHRTCVWPSMRPSMWAATCKCKHGVHLPDVVVVCHPRQSEHLVVIARSLDTPGRSLPFRGCLVAGFGLRRNMCRPVSGIGAHRWCPRRTSSLSLNRLLLDTRALATIAGNGAREFQFSRTRARHARRAFCGARCIARGLERRLRS